MANVHASAAGNGGRALIGSATAVRGQISAREDLWIEGQLEGEIQANQHQVTISASGRVRAQVRARSVIVEGELHGNAIGEQQVVLRAGSRVHGDIRAPRVALEEGCFFQGTVDMDSTAAVAAAGVNGASKPIAGAPAGDAATSASATEPATIAAEGPA